MRLPKPSIGQALVSALLSAVFVCSTSQAYVSASSENAPEFSAWNAFDGSMETRWASAAAGGEEYLQVDLGALVPLGTIRLYWEHAFAKVYTVLASADGLSWEALYRQENGQDGETCIPDTGKMGRYVKILCIQPGPYGLYSLWEIEFEGREAAQALEDQRDRREGMEAASRREKRATLHAALADAGVREIVYATRAPYPDGHWYANISYFADDVNRKTYVSGGGLYIVEVETGIVRALVEDAAGTLRDPAVHYDGKRILFSWRRGGEDNFHLYTIERDGSGLTQLTSGGYDDIEPSWLPDGGIVFVSSRCRRWVNCWLTQVATIHRCDGDGRNIIPLSGNLEQDNTPWPLPDGRILYTRWEYVDRSQVDYHHLWTMNLDGTGQAVFFGNMHPPGLYIDAKPVPGAGEVVFINSPGHGQKEHVGKVALVEAGRGPDCLPALRDISDNGFRDPWAVSADVFIAARGRDITVMDRDGVISVLHRLKSTPDKQELHEPRPLIARDRETVVVRRADHSKATGRLILADAYLGRNMEGVAPGDIAKLLVVESLPKPINYTGGMDPLSYGGTFTLERILGEVPVEEDGSACFDVPANRSLFFIALDKNNDTIKRMQSFFSVMPGETLSCIGCHEQRVEAPMNPGRGGVLAALKRSPSEIKPIAGAENVFDFPRDIQPILDRHCVACHDYGKHDGASYGPRAGGVILTGDRGPMFSHSYAALTIHRQIADGRNLPVSNYAPRTLGAVASPLMHKIREGHHGVKLSAAETDTIRYWIETGAPYPGTYGALGSGCIGGYRENQQVETDYDWPETAAANTVMENRCNGCHQESKCLPLGLSDENGLSFWRPEWDDPRLKRSRHLVFNLSRPEKSLVLLAPLGTEAGGYGVCRITGGGGEEHPVFADAADSGYQVILSMIIAGKKRLETIKRFDMPGFRPPEPYLREMARYGILPCIPGLESEVDPYQLDLAYWNSFRQEVALMHRAYQD